MKKFLSILLFTFFVKFSLGQTYSIVGAWVTSDSTKETSLFFKQGGNISMHSGSKNAPILNKGLKKGKYEVRGNLLTITWEDKSVEENNIKFLNKNSFILSLIDKRNGKQKSGITFRRVIDEEVVE